MRIASKQEESGVPPRQEAKEEQKGTYRKPDPRDVHANERTSAGMRMDDRQTQALTQSPQSTRRRILTEIRAAKPVLNEPPEGAQTAQDQPPIQRAPKLAIARQ